MRQGPRLSQRYKKNFLRYPLSIPPTPCRPPLVSSLAAWKPRPRSSHSPWDTCSFSSLPCSSRGGQVKDRRTQIHTLIFPFSSNSTTFSPSSSVFLPYPVSSWKKKSVSQATSSGEKVWEWEKRKPTHPGFQPQQFLQAALLTTTFLPSYLWTHPLERPEP